MNKKFKYQLGDCFYFEDTVREVISRLVSEKDNKNYYLLSKYGPPVLEEYLLQGLPNVTEQTISLYNEPLQC